MLPKQFWEFADIDKVGRRPVLAYVVSALLAPVAAGSISLCYNMVLDWDIDAGLADFARRSPWLTMSFVSAGGLAFLCDDFAPTGREPRWLRWVEAAGGSAVLMLSGWLVCQWLGSTPGLPPTDVPDVRVVLPIDCVIGFLLAGTIPHWYRSVAVARPTPPVVAAVDVAGLVSG